MFNKSFLSIYEVIKSFLKKKSFASGLLIGISIFTVFGFSLSNNDEGLDAVDESQKINNITSTTIEVVSDENNSQDLSPPLFTDDVDLQRQRQFLLQRQRQFLLQRQRQFLLQRQRQFLLQRQRQFLLQRQRQFLLQRQRQFLQQY